MIRIAIHIHMIYHSASMEADVKTVQMTLDDELVRAVDRVAKRLRTSRSAFTRDALRAALARDAILRLEQKHRDGYERHPVTDDEFSVWEGEQAWGDE